MYHIAALRFVEYKNHLFLCIFDTYSYYIYPYENYRSRHDDGEDDDDDVDADTDEHGDTTVKITILQTTTAMAAMMKLGTILSLPM